MQNLRMRLGLVGLILTVVILSIGTGPVEGGNFDNDPRLQRYLKILRSSGQTIDSIGTLFEVLLRDDLAKRFPADEYEITGSLEYLRGNQVTGELDLLVFRRSDGACVMVGEAKFWRNLSKALKKAKAQLKRYRDALNGGTISRYRWKPDPSRPFADQQFIGCQQYETFGPQGATEYGFTHAFDLATPEGAWLLRQVRPRRSRNFSAIWNR